MNLRHLHKRKTATAKPEYQDKEKSYFQPQPQQLKLGLIHRCYQIYTDKDTSYELSQKEKKNTEIKGKRKNVLV